MLWPFFLIVACAEPKPPSEELSLPPEIAPAAPTPLQGTYYYSSFQGITGVYYGVGPLTREQAETLSHIEIDYVDDFPVQMRGVGPAGRLERTWYIERSSAGVSVVKKDRFGLTEETRTCNLERKGEENSLLCTGLTGSQRPLYLGCDKWREHFDRQRRLTKLVCLDQYEKPRVSAENWTVLQFSYDEENREVERRAFDDFGRPVTWEVGFHLKKTSYTPEGRVFEERYFGKGGTPVAGPDGVHLVRYLYDERGLIAAFAYFDEKEAPTLASNGAHRVEYLRNQDGDPTDWRFVDTSLAQVQNTPQICTRFHAEYDEQGLMILRECKDPLGNPATRDSVYRTTFKYDSRGRQIEARYYSNVPSSDGTGLSPTRLGLCYGERYTYDAYDRLSTETCLDTTGSPFQPSGFYCRVAYTYDASGFLSRKDDQDCAGRLTTARAGIASTVYERDAAGRILSSTYLDASGYPFRASFGYSQERWKYDPQGRAEEETFWHNGIPVNASGLCFDGKMCTGKDGVPAYYHKMRFLYTPAGERTTIEFYDTEGTLLGSRDCRVKYCP